MSTEDPSANEVTPYTDCEANTVDISIDAEDNDSGYTTPALTGKHALHTITDYRRHMCHPACTRYAQQRP
jgi:hypothetical protein